MDITGIDLEAIAEAAAYHQLHVRIALALAVLVAVVVWAKWEGAWE